MPARPYAGKTARWAALATFLPEAKRLGHDLAIPLNWDPRDSELLTLTTTLSHAGLDANYFAADCPHTKSEDSSECMCPVDGAHALAGHACMPVNTPGPR